MAVEILNNPKAWNASLSYVQPGATNAKNRIRVYRFWLMEIEQPHQLSGKNTQSKLYTHFYAKSYSPGQVEVQGRVRTQAEYDLLAVIIRTHQKLMVSQSGRSNATGTDAISLMTLGIKDENLYYAGWIPTFQGGAKRFNPAPPFTFRFEVIHDKHSTANKIIPSAAKRNVFSGAFLTGALPDPKAPKPKPFEPFVDTDKFDLGQE
jgi:hypothetical protein